jgi:hypothetical protein
MRTPPAMILALLIALLCAAVPLAAEPTSADRAWVLDTLKKYSPDGWYIVNTFLTQSDDEMDFMEYWGGSGEDQRWESINTIVHELAHGYMSLDMSEGINYYISPTKSILVKVGKVYRTNKMVDSIPENLKTFRFDYVDSEEENLGSQSEGAYGLLDEMNAYWVGVQAASDMLPLFKAKGASAVWKDYFNSVNASLYGIVEFRFFVLRYILWAKDNDKKVYDDIMANAIFRSAFSALDRRACDFTTSWVKGRAALYESIKKMGVNIREQGTVISIGNDGAGTFFDIYELMRQEMLKPLYTPILTALHDGKTPPSWPDTGVPPAAAGGYQKDSSEGDSATFGSADSSGSQPSVPEAVTPTGKVLFTLDGKDRKGDAKQKFIDIVKGTVTVRKDGAVFSMELAALPATLPFDAAALKVDRVEYEWAFDIDTDADGTVDYSLGLSSMKAEGDTPTTAAILDECSLDLWKYEGDEMSWVEAPVKADIEGTTIVLTINDSKDLPMASLSEDSYISARTYYDNGSGSVEDTMEF